MATIFTNIQQLVGLQITTNVLNDLPESDYSTPHRTALSFERAAYEGNYSNMFYASSNALNLHDIGTTNICEVPAQVISDMRLFSAEMHHSVYTNCIIEVCSENRLQYLITSIDMAQTNKPPETFRFVIDKIDNLWKVSAWNPADMAH